MGKICRNVQTHGSPASIEGILRENQEKNQKYIDTWYNLEFKTLTPNPRDNNIKMDSNEKYVVSLLESHYYSNKFFLPPNYIINNSYKIRHIPGVIIHGRLDVICSVYRFIPTVSKTSQGRIMYC